MKKVEKLFCLLLVCAMAFAMMAGCGTKDAKTDTDTQGGNKDATAEVKDSIVIATANEPPMLHPYDHNATAANYMNNLTYSTLFRANVDTLEPEPCLVEKYEILSDTEWKFYLHKGVKFHDGETLTAEDVKASMEWARTFTYTSMYSAFWDKIDVVDDTTFIITTKKPYAKTLNDLTSHKIVPKSLIDSGNDFNANPIGTGPYKFVKWNLGDSLEFVAFDDYFEGAPAIKNMTWRIIPEGSSRTIALEAGEIDFIVEVETNDLTRLKEDKNLVLVQKTGTEFNYMMINNEKAPFDNQKFRKALNCAIDKDAVAQVALSGAGTGVNWQTPSVLSGYSDKNIDKYDVELAKKYIQESGIDPKTVTFSCICSNDTKRRAGEVIQASLADLGITMNLESMDLATYLSTTTDGNYEAALGNYTSTNIMSFIEGVCYSKSIGGSNRSRLNDAEVDRLYELSTTQLDNTERTKTLEECSARLNDLCSQIPTYQADTIRAYNANLQDVGVSASGATYWQYVSWGK
ncbi:MAG: ABC transporter substrate-binding protein [Clostridiaceae bacterium]|nr:ABC transporter substrate-binding protein [Clostridiaceae bacterium]